MKTTILVFAMQEELNSFLAITHLPITKQEGYLSFSMNPQHQIKLVVTGVTMMQCYRLLPFLGHPKPDLVIQVGTCAGLKSQPIGTVIHARTFFNADLNLTTFNRPMGRLFRDEKVTVLPDILISGSSFLNSLEAKQKLIREFNGDAFDMEAFGFFTMCQQLNIPFLSIRGVSDNGEINAGVSFEAHLKIASEAAARATLAYLNNQS